MYYFLKIVFCITSIAALLTIPATAYVALAYGDAQLMSIIVGAGTLLVLLTMYLESVIRSYSNVSLDDEFHDMRYTLARYNDRDMWW